MIMVHNNEDVLMTKKSPRLIKLSGKKSEFFMTNSQALLQTGTDEVTVDIHNIWGQFCCFGKLETSTDFVWTKPSYKPVLGCSKPCQANRTTDRQIQGFPSQLALESNFMLHPTEGWNSNCQPAGYFLQHSSLSLFFSLNPAQPDLAKQS